LRTSTPSASTLVVQGDLTHRVDDMSIGPVRHQTGGASQTLSRCSVNELPWHDGSRQTQGRLRHATRTAGPKHGVPTNETVRRPWPSAITPHAPARLLDRRRVLAERVLRRS
jgi:hypothetical protein